MKKPNLLFLIMDDQRADTIHALGNPVIHTPNLDRLASEGISFRPYTTVPVCTPARGELLSGCNALRNGCDWFGKPLHRSLELLPEALRRERYRTGIVGKWHNDRTPLEVGFDERFYDDTGVCTDTKQTLHFEEDGKRVSGNATELHAEAAARFLRGAPRDRPWFLYVGFLSPHDPRSAPEPWAGMYRGANKPPLPANYMPEHPFDNGDMMIRDELLEGYPRTHDAIAGHLGDYYAMISHHDHYIGAILRELELSGEKDNTIVVFTSDHGLAIGSHGLMGKENLYEHSCRVPFIISAPQLAKGKRLDELLCAHYDFMPTLFELIGAKPPASCEGISYAGALRGETGTVRDHMFAAYRDCMRMARGDRYKLIHYLRTDRVQLFDLERDPHEQHDLLVSWRRDAVVPPPARYKDRTVAESFNPPYYPRLTREEADRIAGQLQQALMQWRSENGDA
ncbi:MAG: sulfatase-like hydrolase/transferase [Paenibacillaceae bacterium]|nr:sulfatase-like hydrolase/transferase [Paenibacillaceae bacterium]